MQAQTTTMPAVPQQVAVTPAVSTGFVKFLKDCTAGTLGAPLPPRQPHYHLQPTTQPVQGSESQHLACDQHTAHLVSAGGIAVVAVGHPFDTVKVRLQTQSVTNPIYCEPGVQGLEARV